MSKFLHDAAAAAKSIAIPRDFSENSRAKRLGQLCEIFSHFQSTFSTLLKNQISSFELHFNCRLQNDLHLNRPASIVGEFIPFQTTKF